MPFNIFEMNSLGVQCKTDCRKRPDIRKLENGMVSLEKEIEDYSRLLALFFTTFKTNFWTSILQPLD